MKVRSEMFEAKLEEIEKIWSFISPLVECLPERRRQHLDLAVEEIFVNICSYAYEVPPGGVEIIFSDDEDAISLEFKDDGVPFDPLAKEDPELTGSMEDRPQGGLGILLVRRVMDEVHYGRENGQNSLKIVLKKQKPND